MDWSVEYADSVVGLLFGLAKAILTVLVIYIFVLVIAWNQDRRIKLRRHIAGVSLALPFSIALFGVYLTYSVFRNQAQQNAEVVLNNHGTNFVNWERGSPEIICLYNWHAFDDPKDCRSKIFGNPASYRNTMLYIEEVLFLLETARADRERWGSRYAEDITFWAEDISADPTGMFAYNLVSENMDPLAAVERSGLVISDEKLCGGFATVVRDLSRIDGANIPAETASNPLTYCMRKLADEQQRSLNAP